MKLNYSGYDANGARVSGTLEADSSEAAQERLRQSGFVITQLNKAFQMPSRYDILPSLFGVTPMHLISFSRGLATLMEAGVPLRRSLPVMYDQSPNSVFKRAIRKIQASVEEGKLFSESCAEIPSIFPTIYVRLLKIGEETGRMAVMLHQLADQMEKQTEASYKIKKALTYPAIVMVVSAISVFVLITFSLPALSRLFDEFDAQLPFMSRVLVVFGNLGEKYTVHFVVGSFIFVVAFWRWASTRSGKKALAYFFLRMPLTKRLVRARNTAWFATTLASLLAGGIALVDSIELMLGNVENEPMKKALTKIRSDLLAGTTLSASLAHIELFPSLVSQSITVSEETGNLTQQLQVLSKYYETEADRTIDSLTGLIEPAIILGVGLVVGTVGITVINTVYALLPSIK